MLFSICRFRRAAAFLLFSRFDELVHRKKKFFLVLADYTKHTIPHSAPVPLPATIVIMWICLRAQNEFQFEYRCLHLETRCISCGSWGDGVILFLHLKLSLLLLNCVCVCVCVCGHAFHLLRIFLPFSLSFILFEIGFWTIRCVCVCVVWCFITVSTPAFNIGMVFTW